MMIGIFVLCTLIAIIAFNKDMEVLSSFCATVAVLSAMTLVILFAVYSGHSIIDDKIDLYKSENAKIEEQISDAVVEYMGYEANTLEKLRADSAITIASLYPTLASNELVSKQIEVYITNNETIKELEVEKLSYRVIAWWIYFGG